ncbi:hypothetical protein NQ317_011447 [Molorchus minor]|uniref:Polyprenal reductase n=1 Tax=Molorchus minor TaxID=1323400 RepID=A0ABQ9IUZ0_9CUCU|nr:hypothetical protein NQ317_011447 [Molorchus minor]
MKNLTLQIPKSWFRHFYILAVFVYTYIFYIVTNTYIFRQDIPNWFTYMLKTLCGEERYAYASATKTYIAIALMTLQVYRRFYDTHFISIFGKSSKINFITYLVGLYHYVACGLAIICEAPKFADYSSEKAETVNVADVTSIDIFSIFLFLWAWWHQHTTTKILADLRKNKEGVVVTDAYNLPEGDWFSYLTAPHQTAEILMYGSITILLWPNTTWFFVFIWVLSNQVETILLSHWWYQETFDKFPKTRKALIPFIY